MLLYKRSIPLICFLRFCLSGARNLSQSSSSKSKRLHLDYVRDSTHLEFSNLFPISLLNCKSLFRKYHARAIQFSHNHFHIPRPLFCNISQNNMEKNQILYTLLQIHARFPTCICPLKQLSDLDSLIVMTQINNQNWSSNNN